MNNIDPSLAIDLGDEHAKAQLQVEAAALAAREAEMRYAAAWYKAMRRSFGQRDRINVFLKAEMRRKARESR